MSFKFSSIARVFSSMSHKVEGNKKNSSSQFVTVTSHKTEKIDSKDSGSKISRFFHRLFHSKEKAQTGVETAFQKKNSSNPVGTHKTALVNINEITQRTAAPKYFVMLGEHTAVPSDPETELNRRHEFIESNEGRFMIDIMNMGSCIDNPPEYFRALPGLDLQKAVTDAFQIYYEEGKRIHEDSVATPGWGYAPTAQSLTDLENLKATLEKISPKRETEQTLIQKAKGAIEGRIDRITEEQQKQKIQS